jgi:hypothetical protein
MEGTATVIREFQLRHQDLFFLEKVFSDNHGGRHRRATTCGRVCTSHRAVLKSERVSLFSTSSV